MRSAANSPAESQKIRQKPRPERPDPPADRRIYPQFTPFRRQNPPTAHEKKSSNFSKLTPVTQKITEFPKIYAKKMAKPLAMPVFIGIFAFATGVDIVDIGIHRQATYFFITVLTERILPMKKFTAIAVAGLAGVIGFTSVAFADASFYGRVTAGAVHVDNDRQDDDGSWNFGATGIDGAQGRFNGTRFGFKGEQDLGNGMSAGFQIEREVRQGETPNVTRQRHNLVWLSGSWGKLTLGNQNNPFMKARNWDQTYLYGGNWGHGAGYRHEGINYSMSRGPFSLNVMAMASSGDEDDTVSVDVSELPSPATLSGANAVDLVAESSGNDGIDGWVIHAGYDFGVAAVNVAHQASNSDFDITTAADDDSNAAGQSLVAQLINNTAVDVGASRNLTAIGFNGSVGVIDWYLAYQTTELNASGSGYEDNDVDSIGGLVGFDMSEKDTVYVYYVAHSGDRLQYNAGRTQVLGEDYTETIVGYSRDMGPGLRFIAEYAAHDQDLDGADGDNTSVLGLAIRYVF